MSYIPQQGKPYFNVFQDQQVSERHTWAAGSFIYNIHPDVFDTTATGTATVTVSNSMAKVSTGADATRTVNITSRNRVTYTPSMETWAFFTALWETGGVANATQYVGLYGDDEGYVIGYNGVDFGVGRKTGGSVSAANFIKQSDLNHDKVDGSGCSGFTLDTTKLNIFKISYGYLGAAPISFWVYGGHDLGWIRMHCIDYPNTATRPHILQTSIPWRSEIVKTAAGTTDIVVYSASVAAGTSGNSARVLDLPLVKASTKSISLNTLTNILTIRAKSTFQLKTNEIQCYIEELHAACEGAKPTRFEIYRNATLGGTPSYSDISTTRSTVEFDTAGTTVTGGILVDGFVVEKIGSYADEYRDDDIIFNPGETITIAAFSTANSAVDIYLRWRERF